MGGGTLRLAGHIDTPLWVYPRVGGGTFVPRHRCVFTHYGSIPAWAGEPWHTLALSSAAGLSPRGRGNRSIATAWRNLLWRVYPRVGGGTLDPWRRLPRPVGSIPAWAGEPCGICPKLHAIKGLSPRGRGNRRLRPVKPCPAGGLSPRGRGNPKVLGGGTALGRIKHGLSPRGRGNPYFANTNKVGISPKPIIGTSPSLLSDG